MAPIHRIGMIEQALGKGAVIAQMTLLLSQKTLDSLGRDMKKHKENVHAKKVGYDNYEGMHQTKECPLNDEADTIEEVKYGEFGKPFLSNSGNEVRHRVGLLGYYTRVGNHPPFGEKKPILEETINKYLEESTKKQAKNEYWMKKFKENTDLN
nr:hypothetical protein [Tanacetum cinerariifolium]